MKNFRLSFDIFEEKGGGGPDPNPNILRNSCLLELSPEKKFPEHIESFKREGVKAVQLKSKIKVFFSVGVSLNATEHKFYWYINDYFAGLINDMKVIFFKLPPPRLWDNS